MKKIKMTNYIKKKLTRLRMEYIRIRKLDDQLNDNIAKIIRAEFKKADKLSTQEALDYLADIQDFFPPTYTKMAIYQRRGELIRKAKRDKDER